MNSRIKQMVCLLVAVPLLALGSTAAKGKIILTPSQGSMGVGVKAPSLQGQEFSLFLPKTIGCYEMTMVNQTATGMQWKSAEEEGAFICEWSSSGLIYYSIKLIPYDDYVDMVFMVRNFTRLTWSDVWFFTLLAPQGDDSAFRDEQMLRTYMQVGGKPMLLSDTDRETDRRPEIMFYLHESIPENHPPHFVEGFQQTSTTRPDGNWMISVSKRNNAWIGTVSANPVFLFNNSGLSSLHVAPGFGDIGPGEKSEIVSRVYFSRGNLKQAIKRIEAELPELASRAKQAPNKRSLR